METKFNNELSERINNYNIELYQELEDEKRKYLAKNKALKLKQSEINAMHLEIENSNAYKSRLKLNKSQMGPLELQNAGLRDKINEIEKRSSKIATENHNLKQLVAKLKNELKKKTIGVFEKNTLKEENFENKSLKSFGNKLDGSLGSGIHRESGKFGSLPSFDNYDDEYNESLDPSIGLD